MITNREQILLINDDHALHPIKLRIPSSDEITYEQVFKDKEYDFKEKTEPQVIIDAGANIGLASIFFANKFPSAKILSIEPEINNFKVLKENVEPYSNITPIHAALWDKNKTINLVDPGLGSWGFMTENDEQKNIIPSEKSHVIQAITIDRIINDHKLDIIDILKIDIEGAEKEVFSDTESWLTRVNMIIIELHERLKPGCNRNFYNGSNGFDHEWLQGENIFLTRNNLTADIRKSPKQ